MYVLIYYANFSHIIIIFIHLKTTMNLFIENPRVYGINSERGFKLEGPFVVSRD